MHRAVAALARSGLNVVVDHVLSEPDWPADLERAWSALTCCASGCCARSPSPRNGNGRGNRTLGWVRAHADVVHAHIRYDLTVDTSEEDPAGCAEVIRAAVAARGPLCRVVLPPPAALSDNDPD
jgi:chloramphenicol 3-O phosphotransferase